MTAPDYARLIDAPTWAFIRDTDAAYPPDTATRSIAEQRAIYDAMCREFLRGYPPGVTSRATRWPRRSASRSARCCTPTTSGTSTTCAPSC